MNHEQAARLLALSHFWLEWSKQNRGWEKTLPARMTALSAHKKSDQPTPTGNALSDKWIRPHE